jgi:deoxyribonuclease-4
MILGAHESVAGGLHRVFERAARDQASAVQLFTRSSRQWAAKPLTAEEVGAFRVAHRSAFTGGASGFPTAAHASYLINLAAPDDAVWHRSIDTLVDECRRAQELGIGQVIVHPGAALGSPVEVACARVGAALRRICDALGPAPGVRLLLELTAGQGSSVGCSLPQLETMLEVADAPRLGVCLDTQHMWAAGIDWTTPSGYDSLMDEVDRRIGLGRVEAFHLNDSNKPLGGRVDRHERIGDGVIGVEPFRRLLLDPRLSHVPGYLETPPLADGEDSYQQGLERLRALL